VEEQELKKNRRIIFISLLIMAIVSTIACSKNVYTDEVNPTATTSEGNTIPTETSQATETSLSTETSMPTETSKFTALPEYRKDLLEWAYDQATDEQKQKLDEIKNDKSITLPGQWTKRILIVMNELPIDTPMLSLSIVETILLKESVRAFDVYSDEFTQAVVNEFNIIAGAPDYEGGSGTYQYEYFLNNEHTQIILVVLGTVKYIVKGEDGSINKTDLCKLLYSDTK
jgi:hypothetical protein